MSNLGRIIQNEYCNGYFGNTYDLSDSIIIYESNECILVRKVNGMIDFCNFQYLDSDSKVVSLTKDYTQQLINNWCN